MEAEGRRSIYIRAFDPLKTVDCYKRRWNMMERTKKKEEEEEKKRVLEE